MSKKIHTVQFSDKNEFDKEINLFLELGCELLDGGYQVINNDDGVVYSQVIVLKNCEVEFRDNGQLYSVKGRISKELEMVVDWYENGNKSSEFTFNNDVSYQEETLWYENGQRMRETTYKDFRRDGIWTYWYENGNKKREENYKDDERDGVWTYWYENGQKKWEITYKDDGLTSERHWNEDGSVKE